MNQAGRRDAGACPSQDLFPAMGPVMGVLLRASQGGKGRAGDVEERLFLPALRVALALLQCPLEGADRSSTTALRRTRVTLWQWAMRSGSEGTAAAAAAAGGGGGAGASAGCQDGCQAESKLQNFVLEWGSLVGLLAVARGGGEEPGAGQQQQPQQQQRLDLLIEELQKQTAARHAEVATVRAKSLFTLSRHVWGQQSGSAEAGGVGTVMGEMTKGGIREGWTEEEGRVAKQVRVCLLAGVNEGLENVVGGGALGGKRVGLWERVMSWL